MRTTEKLGIPFLLPYFLVYPSPLKGELLIDKNPLRVE